MENRFLRLPEVMRTVGLGRSAIYERVSRNEFPKPVALSGRAVAWVSSDIQMWIDAQVKASRRDAA